MTLHRFARAFAVVLVMVFAAATARAQTWHGYSVEQPPPDCNLRRVSSDNFIGDGHRGTVVGPRYELHLISIASSVVASVAVHKLLHLSPVKSAALGGLGTGLIPHYRSVILQRRYPIDPGDVVADATMRMLPFVVVAGHKDHSWTGHALTALSVVASYAAVACWAHP